MLPKVIKDRGANVDLHCWKNNTLNAHAVAGYNVFTFPWCNGYHRHPEEFPSFVKKVRIPTQEIEPRLHIFNERRIVLWNTDKHYLNDLAEHGFNVPSTEFVEVRKYSKSSLVSRFISFSESKPVVLKPAISRSAHGTHLIKDPRLLTSADESFLDRIMTEGPTSDLIMQEYAGICRKNHPRRGLPDLDQM